MSFFFLILSLLITPVYSMELDFTGSSVDGNYWDMNSKKCFSFNRNLIRKNVRGGAVANKECFSFYKEIDSGLSLCKVRFKVLDSKNDNKQHTYIGTYGDRGKIGFEWNVNDCQ
ncbi:MAG: hypothetical protein ACO20H_06210 [Bacteriovoracaceae bacterium]